MTKSAKSPKKSISSIPPALQSPAIEAKAQAFAAGNDVSLRTVESQPSTPSEPCLVTAAAEQSAHDSPPWSDFDPNGKDWRSINLRLNQHDMAQVKWLAERKNRSVQWVLNRFVRAMLAHEVEFEQSQQRAEIERLEARALEQLPPSMRRSLSGTR